MGIIMTISQNLGDHKMRYHIYDRDLDRNKN